jgi:hypothetical protein
MADPNLLSVVIVAKEWLIRINSNGFLAEYNAL